MATIDPIQSVFDTAKREFENGLDNRALFQDILAVNTIDQVYDAMENLQGEQRKQGRLRYLARAEPFLRCLQSYASVIEVFIQAKPEILSLIWGPIRLLLLWSSETKKSFDAILNITEKLGVLLPQFQEVVRLFSDKNRITATLGLFFRDMLDFYLIALKFFSLRKWQIFFEALWPRKKAEIEVVEANIEKHSQMLRSEVTVEHLRKAHEARAHAFDSFRRIEDSQASQKLQSLEAAIDPRFYDNELDRLRKESCQGTTRWLLQEPILSQWLDMSSSSVNILWLQGIPGAGKTFAASSVVDKALETARTLYIFASYRHTSTTAISILQSLLFQLSSDEPSAQLLLTEFNKRDLRSNTKAVAELLKTAISVVGPVFVIVDGVDEIDDCERTHLLYILLETLKESSEMKLCFSSRAEDDIDRMIGTRAEIIRVDRKNSGSIQSYVNHRTKQLIDKYQFSPAAESEIKSLISPLAANSKGMFLFARVVMDNVIMLNDVEEVRRELRALPKDLDVAYQRIFNRVNRLSPSTLRQKAIKILGWVATSPVPLTLGELQQALLVGSSTDEAPTVSSLLNIVELCGPIVEVKDDQPQLVHFTVQEYLSNSEFASFLDKEQATMDLLSICVSYLCYDTMSGELSDAAIADSTLLGRFRLLDFVAINWMVILATCYGLSPSKERMNYIQGLLADLISKRTNYWFDEPDGPPESVEKDTVVLEDYDKTVLRMRRFIENPEQGKWELRNAERWVNLDPLTISSLRVRVHNSLDNLLCKEENHQLGCNCGVMPDLQRHWGSRLFKCHFFSCSFFRQGFPTRKARDDHLKHHKKPWKCFASGCDWAEIGFTSKYQRDNHWFQVHQNNTSATPIPLDSVSDPDVLQSLLFELVSIGNVDELQRFLPHATSVIWEVRWELSRSAARRGSLPMVQLLFPWCFRGANKPWDDDKYLTGVVVAAIESEDVELIKWILPKSYERGGLFSREMRLIFAAVILTNSFEVFDVWEDSLVEFKDDWGHEIFGNEVLVAAKNHPAMEKRLTETWRMLVESKQLTQWYVCCGLTSVAGSSLSIPQAKVLLELGANVNHPRKPWRRHGLTALHTAVKKSTAEGAEFVKFLLMNGANPKYGYGRRAIDWEIGAIGISRWLGVRWEDIVESTREYREADSDSE